MKKSIAWVWGAWICVLAVSLIAQDVPTPAARAVTIDAELLRAFAVRGIGPGIVSGRIADVAIDPQNSSIWYVASAFGGLWKTVNRGLTFIPIFDAGNAFTLCCVVVDPRDSNVIWLGTGENASQRSAHFGDGVYKSVDAGRTWTRVGLEASEHIGRILIDPRDSDVVYVASQGPLFSAGGDRGLYKTTDAGVTWTRVLHISDDTGITDVAADPENPDILYAGTYQRRRHVGQMIGGGSEGGLFRSTDAGRTWTRLTRGLPPGEVGRIAVATDPHHPGRVFALIEARPSPARARSAGLGRRELPPPPTSEDAAGFYRSDDRGESWTRLSRYRGGTAAYYGEIVVDPRQADTIWAMNTTLQWTRDGGRTWMDVGVERPGGAHAVHVDQHAIAFDPANPDHLLLGNDGGLYESYDSGVSWRFFANLPVTQFYRVAAGSEEPFYTVCGGTQDNFSMCGPSRTAHVLGIRASDWSIVAGGDGFSARHDPADPDIVYSTSQEGGLARFDRRTGRSISIRPTDSRSTRDGPADRINWDAPYITSIHAPGRLYWASNYLYRSDDRGETWTRVSPDLTRDLDWRTLPIMGRVWPAGSIGLHESTTALSTIVSLDESPLVEGLLYAGTDDGLLQVSGNGGEDWRRVDEFPGVPRWTYVSDVFASPRDADTVFVALNNWQTGDYQPYIVRSDDRGRTWVNITGDLPARHDVWAIVQDHVAPDLLFAGTEFGLFVSVDAGMHWAELEGGMPPAQVRDVQVQERESDLVIGTFGRGVFVLDDFSALRELSVETIARPAYLFPLRRAYQFQPWGLAPDGSTGLADLAGNMTFPNPPLGAVLTYHLRDPLPEGATLVLVIGDAAGGEVQRIELPRSAGLRRVVWDLRSSGAGIPVVVEDEAAALADGGTGQRGRGADAFSGWADLDPSRRRAALVPPGRYRATLAIETGDERTPVGPIQTFDVDTLPR